MPNTTAIADPLDRPAYGVGNQSPPPRAQLLLAWLATAPLVPAALGLAGGIALNAAWAVPLWMAALLFIAAGAAIFGLPRHDGVRHLAIGLAALALGAALHAVEFRRWPADHIVRYCGDEPALAHITGTVVQTPFISTRSSGRIEWVPLPPRTRLLLDVEAIDGQAGPIAVSGLVAVVVHEPLPHVQAGDHVRLFGTLHRPAPPDNPGQRDWRLVHRRNGTLAEMGCAYAANVTVLSAKGGFQHGLGTIRRRACAAIRADAFERDDVGGRLLEALVLGQRSAVSTELNQAFVNTGTVHYLSVSGAHVGVLMMFVWTIGWLLRRTRRQCALIAGVLVIAYALLTEPSPAITRSAIMSIVFCAAILTRRPLQTANAIAAAALIILIIAPTQLFDAGFQLSFVSLLAILYLAPRLHEVGKWAFDKALRRDDPLLQPEIQRLLNPPALGRRIVDYGLHKLGWALALSVAASLAGAGLCAHHFHQVPIWGWLNTVLIVIPMSAVLLLGLAKTAVSAVFPAGGVVQGWPLKLLTDFLIWCVHTMDRLPWSGSPMPEVPTWLVMLVLGALGLWVVAPAMRIRGRWVVGALTASTLVAALNVRPLTTADTLQLDVLSVGNGSAVFVQFPGGKTMLYDLGSRPPFDLQRWTMGPFLAHQRRRSIDTLAISHPEMDHFSGVPDLLDRVRVGELVTSPYFEAPPRPDTPAAWLLRDLAGRDSRRHTAARGQKLDTGGGATVEVLWPPGEGELRLATVNDRSLVLRITYAGRRILLCGDIEEAAERHLILAPDIGADVLILPHHGGVVRTTGEFIRAVDPTWCIRSSGQRDRDTRNGLLALVRDRKYLNTAECGAVTVRITPDAIAVAGQR